jgi:phasin
LVHTPPGSQIRRVLEAAAEESGTFMSVEKNMSGSSYQIPTEVRDFAEKSVEQARKAFEGFSGAAQKAISSLDAPGVPFSDGAKDLSIKALAYADANVKASFDLAQKLVQAKDPQEVLQLQSEYLKSQFQSFQDQAKEFGTFFQKVASK